MVFEFLAVHTLPSNYGLQWICSVGHCVLYEFVMTAKQQLERDDQLIVLPLRLFLSGLLIGKKRWTYLLCMLEVY